MDGKQKPWHGLTDEDVVELLNRGETHAMIGKRIGLRAASVSAHVKLIRKRSPHLTIKTSYHRVMVDPGVMPSASGTLSPRDSMKIQVAKLVEDQRNLKYDPKDLAAVKEMVALAAQTVKLVTTLYPDDVSKDLIVTKEAAGGSSLRQRMQSKMTQAPTQTVGDQPAKAA